MPVRSLVDSFLFTLGLLPSNDNFQKIIENLTHIPLSDLSSILLKYRFRGSENRDRLIEKLDKLDVDQETQNMIIYESTDGNNLWNRLRYCGSGITPSMFDNMPMDGNHRATYKILEGNTYTKNFLKRFEYLWVRDKALRQLEWGLLKIGNIYNRSKLIVKISDNTVEKLLKTNTTLIDIISLACDDELFLYSIGKSLVYKAKHDSNIENKTYKLFVKWLKLDPIHCTVILGNSLRESGTYSVPSLIDRFQTRVKSDKYLTKKLQL